jgi:hypothetical protein
MARDKAADQDIGFLGAAMLGAKNKPAAPGIKFCWVWHIALVSRRWHIEADGNPVSPP